MSQQRAGRTAEQVALWASRALWVVLPFTLGPAIGEALAPHSSSVRLLAEGGFWAGWVVALAGSLVPRSSSLTVCRLLAPGALAGAIWALAAGASGIASGIGVASAALAVGAFFLPATAEAFVDGSSYGDERRFTLRVPPALALGPIPLAWLLLGAAVASGPMLLAARQWVAGAVLVAVGAPIAVLCARRLHVLSRRWVVFVPAGMVLHDPLALADAALIPKNLLAELSPAPADFDGFDLSMAALGLALQARFTEPLELNLPVHRDGKSPLETTDGIAFTPTRPATLLASARERGLPAVVG
jgi:hypothetical protein